MSIGIVASCHQSLFDHCCVWWCHIIAPDLASVFFIVIASLTGYWRRHLQIFYGDESKEAVAFIRDHYMGNIKPRIISLLMCGDESVPEYVIRGETTA